MRPRMQTADLVVNGAGWLAPVHNAVLFGQAVRVARLRIILGRFSDGTECQAVQRLNQERRTGNF